MIAHVAEAGETRGRVVLRLSPRQPHQAAIAAAVRLAHAFQAELESLFVEDAELFQSATFAFAREIGFGGRGRRMLSAGQLANDLAHAARAAQRHVERVAALAGVPVVNRIVRADPVAALQAACAEVGPWNVIALAEPVALSGAATLRVIMQSVTEAQGLLVVGPRVAAAVARAGPDGAPAPPSSLGPVLVAIEQIERLGGMMHAAERIAKATGDEIVVLLISDTVDGIAELEGHARLLLAGRDGVRLVAALARHGEAAAVIDVMHRLAGGFLLASLGGLAMPTDEAFALVAGTLACPVMLVR